MVAAGQNYETEYWESQYINGITVLIDFINVLGHWGRSNSEFVIYGDVTTHLSSAFSWPLSDKMAANAAGCI
jgi:hypothetical protein